MIATKAQQPGGQAEHRKPQKLKKGANSKVEKMQEDKQTAGPLNTTAMSKTHYKMSQPLNAAPKSPNVTGGRAASKHKQKEAQPSVSSQLQKKRQDRLKEPHSINSLATSKDASTLVHERKAGFTLDHATILASKSQMGGNERPKLQGDAQRIMTQMKGNERHMGQRVIKEKEFLYVQQQQDQYK